MFLVMVMTLRLIKMREGAARRHPEQRGIRQDHEPGNTHTQSGHIRTSHTPHHSVFFYLTDEELSTDGCSRMLQRN